MRLVTVVYALVFCAIGTLTWYTIYKIIYKIDFDQKPFMMDVTMLLIVFFVAYYCVMIGLMVYFYQMGIAYVEILRKEE